MGTLAVRADGPVDRGHHETRGVFSTRDRSRAEIAEGKIVLVLDAPKIASPSPARR